MDYKERLREEFFQLEERIIKLEAFIESDEFSNIDIAERGLLTIQLHAMKTYRACLIQRG